MAYEITSVVGVMLFFTIAITAFANKIAALVLPLGIIFGIALATAT